MSVKVHPKKVVTIILASIAFGCGLVVTYVTDSLRPTRLQLEKLYRTEFDSCTVTAVEKRPYPSRGTYKVFKTDCSNDYFPILGNSTDSLLFQQNPIVIKDSGSLTVRLIKEGVTYAWTMKKPETEDDRPFLITITLCFLVGVCIVTLILPNSFFDRKGVFDR